VPVIWSCPICTFINPAEVDMCQMCESPMPPGALDPPKPNEEIKEE